MCLGQVLLIANVDDITSQQVETRHGGMRLKENLSTRLCPEHNINVAFTKCPWWIIQQDCLGTWKTQQVSKQNNWLVRFILRFIWCISCIWVAHFWSSFTISNNARGVICSVSFGEESWAASSRKKTLRSRWWAKKAQISGANAKQKGKNTVYTLCKLPPLYTYQHLKIWIEQAISMYKEASQPWLKLGSEKKGGWGRMTRYDKIWQVGMTSWEHGSHMKFNDVQWKSWRSCREVPHGKAPREILSESALSSEVALCWPWRPPRKAKLRSSLRYMRSIAKLRSSPLFFKMLPCEWNVMENDGRHWNFMPCLFQVPMLDTFIHSNGSQSGWHSRKCT